MEILNNAGLSDLIADSSETLLCDGFGFTEGPIWIENDNSLLFSDINKQTIHRWQQTTRQVNSYRPSSHHSNGLTVDLDGNILACEHSGRRVSRAPYNQENKIETVVSHWEGKKFNSPNDIVVHSNGTIYFTDPTYGLTQPAQGDPNAEQELTHQGVYKVAPDGTLDLLTTIFTQPNGLALSPDENFLYVGDSKDRLIRKFSVEDDGTITNPVLFLDVVNDPRPGSPDGMKVDSKGRLWTTGPGGVWVIESDGTILGQIEIPELPANIAFGSADYKTIFLTARTSVYSINTHVNGIVPPKRI